VRNAVALTVVETLILLMVLAALAAMVPFVSPSFDFARAFKARVSAARLEAVVTGSGTSLPERPCEGASTSTDTGPASSVIVRFPSRGLMFTPDGLPRTCDGGGVGNTTILLEYRGRQAAVIVSSLGRVRWEMR